MGFIVIVVFVGVVVKTAITAGPKVPVICVCLLVAGFFGFPALGLSPQLFSALQALLVVFLLIYDKYKKAF